MAPYMLSTGKENPVIEKDRIPISDTELTASLRFGIRQHIVNAKAWLANISNAIARSITDRLQLSGKLLKP